MNITKLVVGAVAVVAAAVFCVWSTNRALLADDFALQEKIRISDPFYEDRAYSTQQAIDAAAEPQSWTELGRTLYGEDFTNCDTVKPGEGIFDVTTRLSSQDWEYVTVTTSEAWGMYEYYYLAAGNGPIVHSGDEICLLPDGKG